MTGRATSPSASLFKAACSPSNRAASSAPGTELFATNAVRISAAHSIGSDVATSALGLGLRSVTLTPELPLRRESGSLLLQTDPITARTGQYERCPVITPPPAVTREFA